jgi:hypothetical protein
VTVIIQLAALGLLGMALAVWLARVPSARRRRQRPRRRPRPALPADLGAITELVVSARSSPADAHRRLRPLLREIAAVRLARRGIGLDRDPLQARELLGQELWELVRADRELPAGRVAPALTPAELAALTDRLEAV